MARLRKEQLDAYLGEEEAKKYYKDLEKYNAGRKLWWSINWKALFCTPYFAMKNGVIEYYLVTYIGILFTILSFYADYDGEEPMMKYFSWFILILNVYFLSSKEVFLTSIDRSVGSQVIKKEEVTKKQLWGWSLFYYFPLIVVIIVESDISFNFKFKSFDQASHDRFEKALKELKRPNPLQVLATGYVKVPPEKVRRVRKIDSFLKLFREDIENLPYDYVLKKGLAHPFVRDDKEQIVIDKTLGLMWQDDKSVEKPYAYLKDANKSCEELVLGAYDDWHLPTAYELLSIVYLNSRDDYIRGIGMDKHAFKHERVYGMWSLTSLKEDKNKFLVISKLGSIKSTSPYWKDYDTVYDTLYMYGRRCVRREQPLEELRRFEYVEDVNREVILDTGTSLMWQNNSYEKALEVQKINYNYQLEREGAQLLFPKHALKYCEELELGGYDDWYLPNRNQLLQIEEYMDYEYHQEEDPFVVRVEGYKEKKLYYNTSTTSPSIIRAVEKKFETSIYLNEPSFTRCVRDAKVWNWEDKK